MVAKGVMLGIIDGFGGDEDSSSFGGGGGFSSRGVATIEATKAAASVKRN